MVVVTGEPELRACTQDPPGLLCILSFYLSNFAPTDLKNLLVALVHKGSPGFANRSQLWAIGRDLGDWVGEGGLCASGSFVSYSYLITFLCSTGRGWCEMWEQKQVNLDCFLLVPFQAEIIAVRGGVLFECRQALSTSLVLVPYFSCPLHLWNLLGQPLKRWR